MTVTSNDRRVQASGNGSTTTFNFNFEIFDQNDIQVYVDTTLKTITTDYTVSGVGSNSGGSVTFTTAPASSTTVTIAARQPKERTTDFTTGGAFKASTVNDEFDKLVAMITELQDRIERCVHLPITDGSKTVELPVSTSRASKFLSFDSSGNVEIQSNVGEWQGNWVTGTAYEKNDVVKDSSDSSVYIVLGDYTSGASVSADVSDGDLALLIDGTQVSLATAQADLAQAWATSSSLVTGNDSTSDYSAKHYASAASTSASNASTSETNAASSASAASTSETNAATSETNAATSETTAATSETNAATSESHAQEWADNNEDVAITFDAGHYSAKHWAAKAAASASTIDGHTIKNTGNTTSVETQRTGSTDTIYLRSASTDQITVTSTGVTVAGNLTVQGTTTTVNSTNLNVTDNIIVIAQGQASGMFDGGLIVDRGSDDNAAAIWDESANQFQFQYTVDDGSSTSPIGNIGWADLELGGLTVNTDLTLNSGDVLTSGSSLIQNIGSAASPWTNGYITQLHGMASSAQYADLAEHFRADAVLEPGTVVEIGGMEQVTKCKADGSAKAFSVVSTAPAYRMNSGIDSDLNPPVVLAGQVPVKIKGVVKKGDKIVSAGNGYARAKRWTDFRAAVIGRALEGGNDNVVRCYVKAAV